MFWGLVFLLVGLWLPFPVSAQGEFVTDYQVDYSVQTDGLTRARMNVQLTNQLSNIYASEFTLTIGSTNLTNISLTTPAGPLEPKVDSGSQTTQITVRFPQPVLGKDKTQQFTLEFYTSDFSRKLGDVWEISIPKLARSDDLDHYRLTLTVPKSFGVPAAISPAPASQTPADGVTIYRFVTDSLLQNGISATFGQEQNYDFSFTYHLTNPNLYPVQTEIALPPDTAWQQVLYQTLEPRPVNVSLDPDGNWLAAYRLGAGADLNVVATGSASLFLKPRSDYPWGLNDQVDYLKPQKYWEADQKRLKTLAGELKTPRRIYDYVVSHLIYDYGRLDETPARLGAANILDQADSALCLEFSDLFIALSRAAGIPARAVNGFAYTDNSSLRPLSLKQDVLHAWPEYYDQERQLWQPVDPTWGNTTGGVDYFSHTDLNHFAFVLQGADSAYPIPAGAYKASDQPAKNVAVAFGRSVRPQPQVKLTIDLPGESLAGANLSGTVSVENSGNVALYQVPVSLSSTHFRLNSSRWTIAFLPPFGRSQIEFKLPATAWNSRFTDTLTASTDLDRAERQLLITPAYNLIFSSRAARLALFSLLTLVVLKLIHARVVKKNPVK